MLSCNQRLQKKKDIDEVFKKGVKEKEGFLILRTLQKKDGVARFAFIISKKVSKKANIRNKLRRRMRDIIRKELPYIKLSDNLIIALPGAQKQQFDEIKDALLKLLKKI